MKKSVLVSICMCLLIPSVSLATANMRDYIPAPPGTLLSMLYYNNVRADDFYQDGNKVSDVDLTQNLFLLREVYYTKIGSIVADPQFILPFGDASLNDDSSDGIGDLTLLCTFWVVNNPATKTYVGVTPYLYLPTGAYDEHSSINLGSNRYAFEAEVGFVKGWEVLPGHNIFLEISPSVTVYGDNDDYGDNNELSQDPVFAVESHLSYDLTSSLVVGLSYYGQWGGEREDNYGVESGSKLNNHALGVQMAYNFAPGWQFLLQYKQDIDIDYGVKTKIVQGRLFYAFDVNSLFD